MTTRTMHEVTFPRYDADVIARRRTLFHAPVGELMFVVGEQLHLVSRVPFPRSVSGMLTSVRQVRLLAELDVDLSMLGMVDRAGYLTSWDALHPDSPSVADPMVWRIEFRYNDAPDRQPDPPEWSLAG